MLLRHIAYSAEWGKGAIFKKIGHQNLQKGQPKKNRAKNEDNLQNIVIFCTYFEMGFLLGAILPPKSGLDLTLRHLITLKIY